MVDLFFLLAVIVGTIIYALFRLYKRAQYHKTSYYQDTHTPYSDIVFDKGVQGEYSVAMILSPYQYQSARLLFNLYVPTQNGNTTEIDAVLITRGGVIAIEVKNLSGSISGDSDEKYWNQTLLSSRGRLQHTFYNPIWQNGTHIRALRQVIDQKVPFYSVIVFAGDCTLEEVSLGDMRANVVYAHELRPLIDSIQNVERPLLSDADIFKIYTKLQSFAHADNATKVAHLNHVSQKYH